MRIFIYESVLNNMRRKTLDYENNLNLIKSAAEGDINAFENLIKCHYAMLRRLVLCKVGSAPDSDDVLQEILLVVWLNINKLKKPEAFKAWLIRIANNCCNKLYIKNSRIDEPLELKKLTDMIDSRNRWETEPETNDLMLEEIDQLPPGQRMAVVSFYLKDLKICEISRIHHIPMGTVKRRLHDGRKSLKNKLEEKNE